MKAKEYFDKLVACDRETTFNFALETTLDSFIEDIEKLVKARNPKFTGAFTALMAEVNNKWHTLVVLAKKYGTDFFGYEFADDGLYKYMCEQKHEYCKYFPQGIKKREENERIKREKRLADEKNKALPEVIPHRVIPLPEITKDNILTELMCLYMAVGNYYSGGIPIKTMIPLIQRTHFLEYWKANGINYEEIPLFEADRQGFLNSIVKNLCEDNLQKRRDLKRKRDTIV